MVKLAINGFGRIGRNALKIAFERKDVEIVAINDLTDTKTLAKLLQFDSSYGIYDEKVGFDAENLVVKGKKIRVFSEKDPLNLPWKDLGVDVVIESTGLFTDPEKAKAHLSRLGDSLDMFAEGTAVKIHIHTKTPANVIEYCQQFGEFATFKMENMTVQHTQTHIANNFAEEYVSNMPPHKKYAYVAVVLGDGMENLYVSAGVDQIVRGGQTMNPSAMDFVKVFDKINADHIIVLPNNSNVIMAAVQAAECYEKADVRVLRTTSMCQGYSALVLADPNAPDIETQLSIMEDSARQVVSAEVTQAIRDSEINGIKIQKGDYIAICDHEIVCSEKTPDKAAESLIDKVLAETDKDVVTVFYGKKASVNAYTKLSDYMLSNHRSVDFGVVYGGQETYEYIISLE